MPKNNNLKILMTAAEVAPFAKVGGLGDVTSSLPPALKKLGHDARIIMPKYGSIDAKKYKLKKILSDIKIPTDGKIQEVNVWEGKLPGKTVKVYFIENEKYFGKKEVYFGNNSERFLFFSLALLHVLPDIKFRPDIIHCHDFHTAGVTDLIKVARLFSGYLKNTRTVYTIHNLNYQGKSEVEVLSTANLTKNSLKVLLRDSQDGDINFMAQGILNADMVNTVSKAYSREIATSMYGAKLEKVIRENKSKISGILNGIDVDFFNPAKDKFIKAKFSHNKISPKVKNKLALQKRLGLPQDKDIPMVAFISRLAWQKGLELFDSKEVGKIIDSDQPCQFVFLGTGHKPYENQLKKLGKKYKKNVSANIMFSVELAQQIYASSDVFLMPSRFEPCGLGQMIAMRYGSVPVVRATGGLEDTVNSKVGFKFKDFESKAMFDELKKALNVYYKNPKKWTQLRKNCMKTDFSWNKSAREYINMYKKALKK